LLVESGAYRVVNANLSISSLGTLDLTGSGNYIGLSWFYFNIIWEFGYDNFGKLLRTFPQLFIINLEITYARAFINNASRTQYTLDMQIKQALGPRLFGRLDDSFGQNYANLVYIGCFNTIYSFFYIELTVQLSARGSKINSHFILCVYFLGYFGYNLLAGYAATSIFHSLAIGLYFMYRLALNSSRRWRSLKGNSYSLSLRIVVPSHVESKNKIRSSITSNGTSICTRWIYYEKNNRYIRE